MSILRCVAGLSKPPSGNRISACLLLLALSSPAWPQDLPAYQDPQAAQAPTQAAPTPPHPQETPEQLQQLVAPIALYPDSLVAQILAASTFPEQVVEADRWVQAHPDLKGDALGHAADQQPWDPSVKALTAFPSVLGNMDKNLPWTSSLGDAYYNQQPEVMDAIQVMRQRAQQAGNLKSTPQQTVETQGSTIVIQPAAPRWSTSRRTTRGWFTEIPSWRGRGGTRIPASGGTGHTFRGESASRSVGSGVSGGAGVIGDSIGITTTQSMTTTGTTPTAGPFTTGTISTGVEVSAGVERERGEGFNRRGGDPPSRSFNGDSRAARGYAEPRGQSGVRSGAFSGYGHGGEARDFSSRGSSSFGGGERGGGFPGEAVFGGGMAQLRRQAVSGGGGHGGGGHR